MKRQIRGWLTAGLFLVGLVLIAATAVAMSPYAVKEPATGLITNTWQTFVIEVYNLNATLVQTKIVGIEDMWNSLVNEGVLGGGGGYLFGGSRNLNVTWVNNGNYTMLIRICTMVNNTSNCEIDSSFKVTIRLPTPTTIPTTTIATTTANTTLTTTTPTTTTTTTTTITTRTTTVTQSDTTIVLRNCTHWSSDKIRLYFSYIVRDGKLDWYIVREADASIGEEREVGSGSMFLDGVSSVSIDHRNLEAIGGWFQFRYVLEVIERGNATNTYCAAIGGSDYGVSSASFRAHFYLRETETTTTHEVTATTTTSNEEGLGLLGWVIGGVLVVVVVAVVALLLARHDEAPTKGAVPTQPVQRTEVDLGRIEKQHYEEEM